MIRHASLLSRSLSVLHPVAAIQLAIRNPAASDSVLILFERQ
jgi:hypothetical protein